MRKLGLDSGSGSRRPIMKSESENRLLAGDFQQPARRVVKVRKAIIFVILSLVFISNRSFAQFETAIKSKIHSPNATVCPNPENPCKDDRSEANDLSFHLANDLKWQNTYYSVEFFAILLKSVKSKPDQRHDSKIKCSGYIGEKERKEVQALFSKKKVFASRFGCTDHMIFYSGTNLQYNFLAVYAEKSKDEAQKTLAEVKAAGKFKGANIRKMQAVYDFGD